MIDYITKINKRSKRIKLQFCAYRGLIISSPKKLSEKRIKNIFNENHTWIKAQQLKHPIQQGAILPNDLQLLALDSNFQITYKQTANKKVIVQNQQLVVSGSNEQEQVLAIKAWIRQQAKLHFKSKLDIWSNKTQLTYSKLTVRSQKSRWGSCSSNGTISLNDQLLFMPDTVLDYIIVHELCHTVHPNHSAKYWSLVHTHYPNYKLQENLLAQYSKKIPSWFRLSLYT